MDQKIYCISGMGADDKVFEKLKLNGIQLNYLHWLEARKNESIEDYAFRMRKEIKHPNPILLGVSFGGMVGIEIAKHISLKKMIVVSGVKTYRELPGWMRISGKLYLNRVLPFRSSGITVKRNNRRLGVSNENERELVKIYRKVADPIHLKWAINTVLNWRNEWTPENIVHIQGENDRIFPVKNMQVDYVIKEGTHMMIYNRAKEISEIIRKEVNLCR